MSAPLAVLAVQAYAGCSSNATSGTGGSTGSTSTASTTGTSSGSGPAFENPAVCGEMNGCPAPVPNDASSKTQVVNLHARGGTITLDVPTSSGSVSATFRTSTYNDTLPGPTVEMTTTASDPANPKEADFLLFDVSNDGALNVCCGVSNAHYCMGVILPMNQCKTVDGDTNMHTHGLHIASATAAGGAGDACTLTTTDPKNPDLPWDNIFIPIVAASAAAEDIMSCTMGGDCMTKTNDQHFVYPLPPHKSTSAFQPAPVVYPHWFGLEWYHPHMHETSDDQVARGMAGALLLRNPAEQDIPVLAAIGKGGERVLVLQRLATDADAPEAAVARLVNGLQSPRMTIKPGETQRWRVLNATSNSAVQLSLPNAAAGGSPLVYYPIGFDGVPTPDIRPELESYYVLPGSRLELLVSAPADAQEGDTYQVTWCEPKVDVFFNLIDKLVPNGKCTGTSVVAATLVVEGAAVSPVAFKPGDKFADLSLFGLTPDLWSGPAPDVKRTIKFTQDLKGFYLDVGDGPVAFSMDQMCMPPVSSKLDTIEEWTLENWTGDLHTFHIHVNPFQIDPALVDSKLGAKAFYQDNIIVPPGKLPPLPDGGLPDGGNNNEAMTPGTVKVRMKLRDYIGTAVFHCHVLFHEDHGMMAAITVSPN